MFESALNALVIMADPFRIFMLLVGVGLGLIIGAVPGISGMFLCALLIPFVLMMDPYNALPLLVGGMAVVNTGDTIPAVLFGVPGTSGAAATILDGYPMAKKGEAARALGASYTASMLGGLFGAVILTLSLPVASPLIMLLGSPEFFMLTFLGVTMIGILSGRHPLKGIVGGIVGLLLATVGSGPMTSYARYTLGMPYLAEGMSLTVIALGLFALPEVFDMLIRGTSIAAVPRLGGGLLDGAKDVFRNWFLLLRSSALGVYIGFLPALGGTVASWLAYGHAVQSSKHKENFGKGDVRGVIAPESANNACKGGEFIPTMLFGIPGSPTMALFLVAFMAFGVTPGSDALTNHLDLIFVIIWSLAIANIFASGICFLLSRPIARVTTMPVYYFAPFLLMLVVLGAFQANQDWGDLTLLFVVGCIGWIMKRTGWPRPPLLVGVVMGVIAERYLMLSIRLFGMSWLLHPGVIVIGLITIASVIIGARWQLGKSSSPSDSGGGA